MNKRCTYCESDKEPYFSRVEPMGFYCVECGHNFDEVDPEDFKEIKKQLASERALADRLAAALMSTDSIIRKEVSLIGQWSSPDVCKEALAAWKEVRKEH